MEPARTPSGDLEASYGNGWIRSTSALSGIAGQGEIRFADGTSLPVPLVGAQAAYDRFPPLVARPPPPGR